MALISVIIPTFNKSEVLSKTLTALNEQSGINDDFEVIVIDDGSTDDTSEIVKKSKKTASYPLSLIKQKNAGPATARNVGILKAKGKIILIINDDTVPSNVMVSRHVFFHRQHPQKNYGLLGYVTWHPDLETTPFMYWLEHGGPYFSFFEIEGKEAGWERLWTCNVSFKKELLVDAGLFDTSFPDAAWEDIELGYRLSLKKLKLLYDPKAMGYHYHPTSLESIKRKMKANGENSLLVRQKIPRQYWVPMMKWPRAAIFIDAVILNKFSLNILEKMAAIAEKRFNFGLLFQIVLLHYRIKGMASARKTMPLLANYEALLSEEKQVWVDTEAQMLDKGIPWWVDIRRARIRGKNIFWRDDPKKEKILRGEEKNLLIKEVVEKGGRVLDLGCGSGWLSLELARNGLEVYGVDASPERIKIARQFHKSNPYKKNFGKLTYLNEDVNRLSFPNEYFDSIVVWDTLHHFPNLDRIIGKLNQFLKKDGQFICFDHTGNKVLKTANRLVNLLTPKNKRDIIIPYEDVLGEEMIEILKNYFVVKYFKRRFSLPLSGCLYLFLSRDLFYPSLLIVTKVDKLLCNSGLFRGEYFFFRGEKI